MRHEDFLESPLAACLRAAAVRANERLAASKSWADKHWSAKASDGVIATMDMARTLTGLPPESILVLKELSPVEMNGFKKISRIVGSYEAALWIDSFEEAPSLIFSATLTILGPTFAKDWDDHLNVILAQSEAEDFHKVSMNDGKQAPIKRL